MLPSVYSTYCFYSFLRLTQWVHDLNILCYEHVLVMIVHAKNSIGVVMFSQSPLESTLWYIVCHATVLFLMLIDHTCSRFLQ